MEKVNVICMKWGKPFPSYYVNRLHNMVKRNLTLPFNFVCFTDDPEGIDPEIITAPIPEVNVPPANQYSPWRKLASYQENLGGLSGKTMFLDLDNIIVDNIDCFFDYTDKFAIIENWTQLGRGIGNSSVYVYEIGKYKDLLEGFNNDPHKVVDLYDNEQIYVTKTLGTEKIEFFPETWCRSFKRHSVAGRIGRFFIEPKLPEGVKILSFHGHPRPHEALEGRWPGKLIPLLKKPAWLSEYWR
jgi:hypothetical protein